jgi:hypothetical protein
MIFRELQNAPIGMKNGWLVVEKNECLPITDHA